jgi:fumarate reductase flavoprotein subunit
MIEPGRRYDVVVVGGGLAGLCAALRAAERGGSVLVLEQGPGERYPCNSRASGGIFHVAYHDMKTDPAELAALLRARMPQGARDDLAEAMAGRAAGLIDWLSGHGVTFVRASGVEWHRWTAAPPRPLKAGLDFPGHGIDAVLTRLAAALRARGGVLETGHRLVAARRDGEGFALSLQAERGDAVEALARSLVIADGGFQGNADELRRLVSSRPDLLVTRGAGTGRGDGQRVARELGAGIVEDGAFYGHLLSRNARTNPGLTPYPQLDTVACAGIVVGADGRRIADEGRGGVAMANAIARLADPAAAVTIIDAAIWEDAGRKSLYPANPALLDAGGTLLRAPDIPALAAACGVDADGLAMTLARYNEAVSAGTAATLSPPRTGAAHPLDSASLIALPLAVGITHTMGGIAIDGAARVLDDGGRPIPGLFAAGTTARGLDGGPGPFYAGGLSLAGITGLLAGEGAADHAGARPPSAPADIAERRRPDYPALDIMARHGRPIAVLSGLAAGLVSGWLASSAGAGATLATGLLIGAAVCGLALLLTDLVRLIRKTLLPEA